MASTTHIQHDHDAADPGSEAQMAYSLDRGHEQRDASLKSIVVFVVVLTISIIVIQLAVSGLDWLLRYQNKLNDPRAVSSVARPAGQQIPPPEPRLQPSPAHPFVDRDDWQSLLHRWDEQLSSYGKVEGDPTRARIPIDRAMDLAVKNGIETIKAAPVMAQPAGGQPSSR